MTSPARSGRLTRRDRTAFRGSPAIRPDPLFLLWYELPRYDCRMKVDKLSVSFDPELGDAVRSAASRAGKPLSSWLAEAAASKLRAEALAEFLAGWEAEHGALTPQEIARAERELGMAANDNAA